MPGFLKTILGRFLAFFCCCPPALYDDKRRSRVARRVPPAAFCRGHRVSRAERAGNGASPPPSLSFPPPLPLPGPPPASQWRARASPFPPLRCYHCRLVDTPRRHAQAGFSSPWPAGPPASRTARGAYFYRIMRKQSVSRIPGWGLRPRPFLVNGSITQPDSQKQVVTGRFLLYFARISSGRFFWVSKCYQYDMRMLSDSYQIDGKEEIFAHVKEQKNEKTASYRKSRRCRPCDFGRSGASQSSNPRPSPG